MGMPVCEMLDRIPGPEIAEWMAYYDIEPWSHDVYLENYRWGRWMALFANANRDPKSSKEFDAADFFPIGDERDDKPKTTPEQRKQRQLVIASMMTTLFGGKVEKDGS